MDRRCRDPLCRRVPHDGTARTQETVDYFKAFQAKEARRSSTVSPMAIPYWPVPEPLCPTATTSCRTTTKGARSPGSTTSSSRQNSSLTRARKRASSCGGTADLLPNDEKFRGHFEAEFVGGTARGRVQRRVHRRALRRRHHYETTQTRCCARMSCVRDESATKSVFTKKKREFLEGTRVEGRKALIRQNFLILDARLLHLAKEPRVRYD